MTYSVTQLRSSVMSQKSSRISAPILQESSRILSPDASREFADARSAFSGEVAHSQPSCLKRVRAFSAQMPQESSRTTAVLSQERSRILSVPSQTVLTLLAN